MNMMQRLINGDCIVEMKKIESESIDIIITSPPYWNQRKYSFWSTYQDYIYDLRKWIFETARLIKTGRYIFWVIPDKLPFPPKESGKKDRLYMPIYSDTEAIASESGLICEFSIVWLKYAASQRMFGSYPYPPTIINTPMTERICVWRKPGKADLSRKDDKSKISLDDWKMISKDIWDIRPERNRIHPAQFPEEIPLRCLKCWSFIGDVVLDPFMGSGTTGIACKSLGRNFIGIELNKGYFDSASQRLSESV